MEPEDSDHQAGQQVGGGGRPHPGELPAHVAGRPGGHSAVEDQQGDHDGEGPVAECLEAAGAHAERSGRGGLLRPVRPRLPPHGPTVELAHDEGFFLGE
jgi:hypothetical protein